MHRIARIGFAKQVEAYEAARPAYPPAAVTRLVSLITGLAAPAGRPQGEALRLVDLASGTGKLTRLMAAHFPPPACLIHAVEAVPEMRAAFRRILPSITCHDGTGHSMPFSTAPWTSSPSVKPSTGLPTRRPFVNWPACCARTGCLS